MPVVGQIATAPLPGVRLTAAETPLSLGAGLAEAEREVAERVSAIGVTVARFGLRRYSEFVAARAELEANARLLSRDRQLAEFEVRELQDPERGMLATKGEATRGLLSRVTHDFDQAAGKLEEGLSDPEKQALRRLVNRRREAVRDTVARYVGQELAAHSQREREASLTLSLQNAVANFDNARRVEEEIGRTLAIIGGIPGLGAEARAAASAHAMTVIHEGVIDSFLSRGLDRAARVYFEKHEGRIFGSTRSEIARKIETASTATNALIASEEIWATQAPRSDADPIQLDRMEDTARTLFRADPKALDATIRYLRERKAGVDDARRERQEGIAGGLWRAVNEGAALETIRRMPEYVAAPGALQLQVSDAIVKGQEAVADRRWLVSQRARTRQTQAEADQERRGFARYWELSRPEVLARMTENQILAETPTLGQAHVAGLIEQRRRLLQSEHTVRAATIDAQLFDTLAEQAGLRPYRTGLAGTPAEVHKARLGQIRNAVEAEIDVEQTARGRQLTREEKATIFQRTIDRQVMIDRWGNDEAVPAVGVVNAQEQTAAYVPLEEIPQSSLNEWVNVIRSEFPRELQASREQILSRYRTRIQRAHAAAVLRLGADEERRRLRGQ